MQQFSATQRATALAAAGRAEEAVAYLQGATDKGDADACFTLAAWTFTGQVLARDIIAAKMLFGKAADSGHPAAEEIYTAFLANGTGGARDWPSALERLARNADDPDAGLQLECLAGMVLDAEGNPVRPIASEPVSDHPQIRLFRRLFSKAECDYLIAAATPLFQPSVVVHPSTGRMIQHPIRTSDVAAFPLAMENPAIHALNRRIAVASGTRPEQGEPLQVLRYRPGQEYRPHSDALPGEPNQRIFTMLVYLNEDFDGGETCFLAPGLKLRGATGDAILFRNADPDGQPDPAAQHAGLPVAAGTKFIASRWIRMRPLELSPGA